MKWLRRSRWVIACGALLFSFANPALHAKPDASETITLRAGRVRAPRSLLYDPSLRVTPEVAFAVGDLQVVPKTEKKGIRLVWGSGNAARSKIINPKRGKGTEVRVGPPMAKQDVYIWRDELGALFRLNPHVLRGKIRGQSVYFFDLDHDGEFFEEDEDAFGLADADHMLPWFNDAVFHDCRMEKVGFDPKKRKLTLRLTPLGLGMSPEGRRVLQMLNKTRAWYGLLPCDVHERLNGWCRKHSHWMATHGQLEHDETPGTKDFSKEGNTAGNNGLVSKGGTPEDAFFQLFDTPLHGYEISSPMMTRTAIAYEKGYLTLWFTETNGMKQPRKSAATLPAIFPPHRARHIPISWWDEIPDPRPGDPSEEWGYPIRVFLHPDGMLRSGFPKDMKVVLKVHGKRRDAVPCVVIFDPDSVVSSGGYDGGAIEVLVLPRPVLDKDTTYHLHMTYQYEGKDVVWDSVFTTGSQRGGRREDLGIK